MRQLEGVSTIHPQGLLAAKSGGLTGQGREALSGLGILAGGIARDILPGVSDVTALIDYNNRVNTAAQKIKEGNILGGVSDAGYGLLSAASVLPMVPNISKHLENIVVKEGLENNYEYIKRSIEKSLDPKYKVFHKTDETGRIIGAAATYPGKNELVIDTIGGMGKGGGSSVLNDAIEESKRLGFGGAVSLTPVGDAGTIQWYIDKGFDLHPGGGRRFLLK